MIIKLTDFESGEPVYIQTKKIIMFGTKEKDGVQYTSILLDVGEGRWVVVRETASSIESWKYLLTL